MYDTLGSKDTKAMQHKQATELQNYKFITADSLSTKMKEFKRKSNQASKVLRRAPCYTSLQN